MSNNIRDIIAHAEQLTESSKETTETKSEIKKGDIVYGLRYPGAKGRPCIIISGNLEYKVVYLTRNDPSPEKNAPTINSTATPSFALCDEIATLKSDCVGDYIVTCTEEEMREVDLAILAGLGIDESRALDIFGIDLVNEDDSSDIEESNVSDPIPETETETEPEVTTHQISNPPIDQDPDLIKRVTKLEAELATYKEMYEHLLDKLTVRTTKK